MTGADVKHSGNTSACKHDDRQDFQLTLSITVRDAEALWRMAAGRALVVTGLDCQDVEDVLGPIEDPQIADCLSMLLAPQPLSGCVFTTMSILPAQKAPIRASRKASRQNVSASRLVLGSADEEPLRLPLTHN